MLARPPQTPATDTIELSSPATYISHSHDPWFNLSYEDWLMRNTPTTQPVLFIYRNAPCVVIGRNQNPWKETTPRFLRERGVPLVRRRSGGGTVYHDLGNTNFSIILPRLLFTRAHGAELVARAMRDGLGIAQCTVNERNDVIIRDGEKDLKVSGSAYKIIQHRAYHHGTMLISSSLAELGQSLRSNSPNIQTKSVDSHRSLVTTLNHWAPRPVRHADFVSTVRAEFMRVYELGRRTQTMEVAEGDVRDRKVWDGVAELKSWEWQYGQTPEFTNTLAAALSIGQVTASLTARHARITSLALALDPAPGAPGHAQAALDELALALVGKRYESLEGADGVDWPADASRRELAAEVIRWLRTAM
ncbi:hypothetical protein Q5752_002841 [Cryptotrichosporon argae]